MLILLINGPAHSGKDHTHLVLAERFGAQVHRGKNAKLLKERTHALYGRPDLAWDHFEGPAKDTPQALFQGLTPREAYIEVSERLLKPLHGDDIVARWFVESLSDVEAPLVTVADVGFLAEGRRIARHAGFANTLLLRIHDPAGRPFEGDSRGYFDIPECDSVDLVNDRTIAYDGKVSRLVEDWALRRGLELSQPRAALACG